MTRLPDGEQTTCWAAGCQDRSVSLWLGHEIRPLFVLEELFTAAVSDLSLRRSDSGGVEIVASSADGTLKCLSVSKAELGELVIEPIALALPQQIAPPVAFQAETMKLVATSTGTMRRRITPTSFALPQ